MLSCCDCFPCWDGDTEFDFHKPEPFSLPSPIPQWPQGKLNNSLFATKLLMFIDFSSFLIFFFLGGWYSLLIVVNFQLQYFFPELGLFEDFFFLRLWLIDLLIQFNLKIICKYIFDFLINIISNSVGQLWRLDSSF